MKADEESIERGSKLYSQFCAYCHGVDIEGLPPEKTALSQNTPNLKIRLKEHTHGDFYYKIIHGRGEMPSFKEDLMAEEIWSIIHYIKSVPIGP